MSRIRSLLLGAALVALLAGCDDSGKQKQAAAPTARTYHTLEACLAEADDAESIEACKDSYEEAQRLAASAPQYASQTTCEDVYGPGACVPRSGAYGNNGYMPFMLGYMMGGGGSTHTTTVIRTYSAPPGSYRSYYSAPSAPLSSGSTATARPSAAPVATAPSSVSRGGFGGSAAASSGSSGG